MAAIGITGALRNTAMDVLDAHADLLPMILQINKVSQWAVTRYAVLPKTHLLYKMVQKLR